MAELKHIKTFENYTQPEVNQEEELSEGLKDLLDPRKSKIDKFLKEPNEKDADKILSLAFAKSFGVNPKLKADVLALPQDEKVNILKKASDVLADPKVGPLKLFKRGETYEIGGIGTIAGTGGGHKG
jgi:hypothetical protein